MDDFADFRDGAEAMNMEKGRAVYLSGLFDSFDAFRLIYKTLLWASHKEADYQKALSSNPNVDCYYYENTDSYALLNNIGEKEKTSSTIFTASQVK